MSDHRPERVPIELDIGRFRRDLPTAEEGVLEIVKRARLICDEVIRTEKEGSIDRLSEKKTLAVALTFALLHIEESLTELDNERALRLRMADEAERVFANHTAILRSLNPERVERQLELAAVAAREKERATVAAELSKLRSEVAAQQLEIVNLRASKRKLREALERARRDQP